MLSLDAGTGTLAPANHFKWVPDLSCKMQKAKWIAIVDDDKAVRDALEMLMRSLGHNASKFGSMIDKHDPRAFSEP
jgi:hypothetical protein